MKPLRTTVARHPRTTFFVLTYLLSWWPAPYSDGQLLPYGPTIAAIVVVALGKGRPGLSKLWGRVRHWQVGWRWYASAVAIPASYTLLALVVSLLLGATITAGDILVWSAFASAFIELALFGGMWEEPGWSGYALPGLQGRVVNQHYGMLKATLLLTGFRALWHLPLVAYGHLPWYDALFYNLGLQLVITWLYNRTQGSVPVVMVAHLASNVIFGGIIIRLFTGDDFSLYYMVFIVSTCVVALWLNSRNRWSMGVHPETTPSAAPVR